MILEVDARGLDCPKPVIETKKALEKINGGMVITTVDNKIAKENIVKFAKNGKFKCSVEEINGTYKINITKGEMVPGLAVESETYDIGNFVIFVGSDKLGMGKEELGNVLIKGYFYTLTECAPYPKAILFVNEGVNLAVEESPVLDHVRILESMGVEVLSCGTCLDFYGLKDKLAVGGVTNMYTIVEHMNNASNTIRI